MVTSCATRARRKVSWDLLIVPKEASIYDSFIEIRPAWNYQDNAIHIDGTLCFYPAPIWEMRIFLRSKADQDSWAKNQCYQYQHRLLDIMIFHILHFQFLLIFRIQIIRNMLNKIFILKLLFLHAEAQAIIKATEKNFPSFVSLTDGKEPLNKL